MLDFVFNHIRFSGLRAAPKHSRSVVRMPDILGASSQGHWGGSPPRGRGGPPAPPWATAADAVGPGGGGGEEGGINWGGDTSEYYTKPKK